MDMEKSAELLAAWRAWSAAFAKAAAVDAPDASKAASMEAWQDWMEAWHGPYICVACRGRIDRQHAPWFVWMWTHKVQRYSGMVVGMCHEGDCLECALDQTGPEVLFHERGPAVRHSLASWADDFCASGVMELASKYADRAALGARDANRITAGSRRVSENVKS